MFITNINNTYCVLKCTESNLNIYDSKCRYMFEAALEGKRTKGVFQIVIGMIQARSAYSLLAVF